MLSQSFRSFRWTKRKSHTVTPLTDHGVNPTDDLRRVAMAELDWALWYLNLADVTDDPIHRQRYCRQARETRDRVRREPHLMKGNDPERFAVQTRLDEVEARLSEIYGSVTEVAGQPRRPGLSDRAKGYRF